MATYKVIQDIESEDKLLGPFSPRQFAYAAFAAFCGWMCYVSISRGAAFLVVFFIPPMALAIFFAFPWGREQTTEVWALARVRFLFKPRKRVWNQDGAKELVTITAPKKIEKVYTDGLSELEVKSRLKALATTIDSRGWAIKNTVGSPYSVSPVLVGGQQSSQRLIDIDTISPQSPATDTTVNDDILDAYNPKAQQFDKILTTNAEQHRARLIASMQTNDQQITQPPSTAAATYTSTQPVQPQTQSEESIIASLDESARQKDAAFAHMNTLNPTSAESTKAEQEISPTQQSAPVETTEQPAVTQEQEAVILNLAHRDDLNISTIERTANKVAKDDQEEVVISLH